MYGKKLNLPFLPNLFLMYRVELKGVFLSYIQTRQYLLFLMYRVELKEGFKYFVEEGGKLVPNVPCGVESLPSLREY